MSKVRVDHVGFGVVLGENKKVYMRVCVYMCVDGYMHVCFYMCVDGYMHVCAKCRCTCVCMSVASAGLRTAVHSVTIQHSLFPVCVHVLICWKQLKTHSGESACLAYLLEEDLEWSKKRKRTGTL